MNTRLIAALALVLALAGLVAGCGGSSSDSTSGEAAISKAAFVKQANAICQKSNAETEKEFEAFAKKEGISEKEEPSKEVQERLVEEIAVPGISKQLGEIRALGFPEGKDGEEAEEIVESAEGNLEEAEEDATVFFNGEPFAETNKKARAYGLTVCGSEG